MLKILYKPKKQYTAIYYRWQRSLWRRLGVHNTSFNDRLCDSCRCFV